MEKVMLLIQGVTMAHVGMLQSNAKGLSARPRSNLQSRAGDNQAQP